MEHMKTIEEPAKMREIVDFVTCDICGSKIETESPYEVNEVKVCHRIGSNYPEGGDGTETSVDLCGKCFDEKLLPWLRSQGAEPQESDWEW
jgi:transcription elongation factor Elf1